MLTFKYFIIGSKALRNVITNMYNYLDLIT